MCDIFIKFKKLLKTILLSVFLLLNSCAYIYHVQLGEIDNRDDFKKVYFEVKVSETGVNIDESATIIKAITKSKKTDSIRDIIKLFQIGPRTGNPVYNEKYAEDILSLIRKKCPNGKTSSLSSIREMRKYPVISGEIIKITGYCLNRKSAL